MVFLLPFHKQETLEVLGFVQGLHSSSPHSQRPEAIITFPHSQTPKTYTMISRFKLLGATMVLAIFHIFSIHLKHSPLYSALLREFHNTHMKFLI